MSEGWVTRLMVVACCCSASCRNDSDRAIETPALDPQSFDLLGARALIEDERGRIIPLFDRESPPSIRVRGNVSPIMGASALAAIELVTAHETKPLKITKTERIVGFTFVRTATSAHELALGEGSIEIRIENGRKPKSWPVRWTRTPAELAPAGVDAPDPWARIAAAFELARAHSAAGRKDRAIEAYARTSSLAAELKYWSEASRASRSAAFIAFQSRKFRRADGFLDRGDEIDRRIGNQVGMLRQLINRGMIEGELGNYRRAVEHARRALELALEQGLERDAALARKLMAPMLQEQGEHRQALEVLLAAREYFEQRAPIADRSAYWGDLGWILTRGLAEQALDESPQRARENLERALAFATSAGDRPREANILLNLAWLSQIQGDLGQAMSDFQSAEARDPARQGYARLFACLLGARLHLEHGDLASAEAAFRALGEMARDETGGFESDYSWRAEYGLGRVALQRGRPKIAREYFQRALQALDAVAARTSVTEARAPFLRDRYDVVEDAFELAIDQGDLEGALAIAGGAAARVLRAFESTARAETWSPQDRARLAELTEAYRAAKELHTRSRASFESARGSDKARAGVEADRARRTTAAAFEQLSAFVDRSSAPPAAALRAQECMLSAVTIRGREHTFLRNSKQIVHRALTATAALAASEDLLEECRTLFVAGSRAESVLEYRDQRGAPLGARMIVAHLPHAAALTNSPSPEEGGWLAVIDPRGDLPEARREAALLGASATILIGDEARHDRVITALASARHFHFAGHGVIEAADPWEAHLQLAGSERLTVADVLVARPRLRLALLAGCETAKARPLAKNETISVSDAFLIAGTTSVLATIRSIHDTEARRFVESFYRAGGAQHPGPAFSRTIAELDRQGDRSWTAFRLYGRP